MPRKKVTIADIENCEGFPKDWKAQVLAEYAAGASNEEIRGLLAEWRGKFSKIVWLRLRKEWPEFDELIVTGNEMSARWWLGQARRGQVGSQPGQINPTAWVFTMKNRFGWKDERALKVDGKHDHKHTAVSDAAARISELAGAGADEPASVSRPH